MDGATISSSAPVGTWLRGDTWAAHSGRTRSNAAAKMTRVEERKTVPDHPQNHKLINPSTMTWKMRLSTNQPASNAG